MSSRNQRPVGRRSATTVFYLLALGSGAFRAVSVSLDVYALNSVMNDPISFGLMSQWISFIVTLLVILILSVKNPLDMKRRPLGQRLDPDFGGLKLLPKEPLIHLFVGGSLAGVSTFSYYVLVSQTEASTVLPYGQLVIIYLLLADLFAEKDTPTVIEVQSIISITLGVLLVGVVPGGFDIASLLIVLGPLNFFSALYTYFLRRVKRYELRPGLRVDSLSMRLWALLSLNMSLSVFTIPLMTPERWNSITNSFSSLLGVMITGSLAIFLAMVMYAQALGRGSMAVVNSLSSVSVVLGIPLTLLGNLLSPGSFGVVSGDLFIWVLRVFGLTLVIIGVIALEATEVRSYVFINVMPNTGDILPALFDIKGVETAAAVAGEHDYLLSIKSRSLLKTRSKVLKKIQQIQSIKDIETLVVIRDYR